MNSKSVLNRIMTLLSLDSEEVLFTDAKTADGTILQSPTFDLGESVEVVSEDGTKTPAPDGEHEIALKDSEGKEVLIKIVTKDGKIEERENVELPEGEAAKIEEEMAAETKEAHPLPNTTDEDPRNLIADDSEEVEKDPLITLSYRIDELEAKIKDMMEKFGSAYPSEGQEVSSLEPTPTKMEKVDEEELPKLDGAPIEQMQKFAAETNKNNFGKKIDNAQASFLAKLYK